jgi:hypothetical protein
MVRRTNGLTGVNVLVRPHPFNIWEWQSADLSHFGRVAIHPRSAYDPLTEDVRTAFYDALFHSAAVVGINTSAMIEAAIVGRPVLSIVVPPFDARQEGTLHFKHLLPENGGFLQVSPTLEQHVAQLAGALSDPDQWRERTARFVDAFVRPHGRGRAATPIVASELEQAAAVKPQPVPTGLAPPVLRALLLVVAALTWPIEELSSEKPFGALRKKLRTAVHRGRKELKSSVARKWL